ncbi:MAG: right-handed parallel beta-helix repeat-containing protein [Verrucomicrobiota bacterium]
MKIHTCFLFFLSLVPTVHQATVIDVSEHGVLPGLDSTFALNRLIEGIGGQSGVTLFFPKGIYEFHPENAREEHRAVSNHDNGIKRMIFPLFGFEDITIDGDGSLFLFHGVVSPFVVEESSGVALKNFTVDFVRTFHDELPIVEIDEDEGSFVVEIDPDRYPHVIRHGSLYSDRGYGWEVPMGFNILFDPETRSPIFNTRDYIINFNQPHRVERLEGNRVRVFAKLRKDLPPVGSVLISYGVNPLSRLAPAIHLSGSSDVTVEGVTILAAGGMGIIAERTENVTVRDYALTSGEGRLVATRADATHFIGCKGTILVENSLFEHMLDDAINVHGAYVKVVERVGDNQFLCEISHFQQWGLVFAEPGDQIALLSRKTILPFHESTVTGFEILNEHRFLLTLEDVPDSLPDGPLSVENLTWNPDVIFRNNIIRENRARGLLLTSKGKILIENNIISPQMHGILVEGDNNKWYESGAVQDLTIRGNTFINVGFEGTKRYPLYIAPLLNETQHLGEGHYHRNIRFVDNEIISFNGHFVFALSVDGLEVSDNTVSFSDDYPEMDDYPSVDLRYSENVTIRGNDASGFNRPLRIVSSADCDQIKVSDNSGFTDLQETGVSNVKND